ncbi:alpha/beta hydrolase [Pararobbsia silviterrae]|uniref:Alpha/beta hydrolase n=1 Tax=Pararobbsia silviterrae TaxID=1792498 RepID=A0A494XUX1_9BURK|nr:alpha/beta hydrolase [Pararobbsia silviterrae]RKP53501.1 alpha/beta hydrolase [Pararobbsia silviterrae]
MQSNSDVLPAIEIETGAAPDAAVIWLHGLGADGNDFVPVVPELDLPASLAVRFVFPHAPSIPITWNNGYVMPGWYDIYSLEEGRRHADENGIRRTRDAVRALIARENARGVPTHRIVLAGFSQGGAIAYIAGLTHPDTLAGIVALSTYIAAPALLDSERSAANAHTPIFAAHGIEDPVVPPELGGAAREVVIRYGNPIEWHAYRMPHTVCLEEIAQIGAWLAKRLAPAS